MNKYIFAFIFCFAIGRFVADASDEIVDISPSYAVRRVGSNLTVLCKVQYPIEGCRMKIGSVTYILKPGKVIDENMMYSGEGFEKGQCGVYIKKVKEEWNGNITCILPPKTGNIEVWTTMKLLVPIAPGAPSLVSRSEETIIEGDLFNAKCVAPGGRPVANITWFLDEEPIVAGVHQPIITDDGSDKQTISQNISRQLGADDNNKILSCRVTHDALDKPIEQKKQLTVHYSPKMVSGTIITFDVKAGEDAKLNVTVRSNPAPTAEWTIGDIKFIAPRTLNEHITAYTPTHLGAGFYNVTLVLTNITKEDADEKYLLEIDNYVARDNVTIKINITNGPAGGAGKLDTGVILAIVLLVLFII